MKFNSKSNYKQTEIGKLPKEWEIKKLKELLIIKGRIGWKGLKKSEFGNKGIIIINGPNLKNKKIDWENCLRVPKWRYDESKEISVKKNDILMTKDGTIGKLAYVRILHEPATLASGIFLIRTKSEKLDPNFLYNYFNSDMFKNLVTSRIEGSVIPHLYQRDIEQLIIPIPSYSEQHDISKILYDLDMKIENLQNQNKLLEQMIQSIFKSWFVNFDGITEFENSELGKIPKGWSVDILSNNIEIKKGRKPKDVLNYKKEGYLPQILLEMFNTGKYSYANTANMIFSEKTDTLMVMDGISSGRSEIGYVGVVGSTIAKISFKRNPYFFHYVIKNLEPIIKSNLTGSAIPHADKNFLNCTMLTIPTSNILNDFEKFVLNLHEQIDNNKKQVYVLIKMRYILLPKLISGEIRV